MKRLSETVYMSDQHNTYRGRSRGNYYRGSTRGYGRDQGRGRGRGFHSPADTDDRSPNNIHTETTATSSDVQSNLCFYCHQPNHIKYNCLMLKRDRIMKSSNFSHSE